MTKFVTVYFYGSVTPPSQVGGPQRSENFWDPYLCSSDLEGPKCAITHTGVGSGENAGDLTVHP